jgi:hypothetical protein
MAFMKVHEEFTGAPHIVEMNKRKILRRVALAIGAYAWLVRPKLLRWGATDEELLEVFPGAELIPEGQRAPTMAITIDARPSEVWPWLVQMGYDRGGFYSWDLLDNFGRPSADRIHPEWQSLKVGDRINAMGIADAWEVAMLEPEHFLGLRARPGFGADALWGFLLKELPNGGTRLIVSGYGAAQPTWLKPLQPIVNFFLYEWTHWIMQTRQLTRLKKLAEARG